MQRKTRNRISTGLFVPAMALAGASFAQTAAPAAAPSPTPGSAATENAQNQASTKDRANAQDRSRTQDQANSPDRANTATPAASAKSTDASSGDSAAAPGASGSSADRSKPTPTARTGEAAAQDQPHAMRASKIIGENVIDAQGDKLGEIEDLVIDANGQAVRYAVLSHGGVLGVGEKRFAYPVSLLKTKDGSDDLVLNVSKEKLEKAPGMESGKSPFDNDYAAEVDRYYGTSSDGSANRQLVRASELIGKDIDDRSGKDAGEIEDLIVDLAGNRVEYAVIDFDDSWAKESDGKLVAIPLESLKMPADKDDKLVIDAPAESVDMSRAFSENQWPDFSEPAWRQSTSETGPDKRAAVTTTQ